ncbi:hypothetical protein BXZ70DRAFT_455082 [Cristinia sonorae]|uniref:Uncharacterized protein n=1 Tax=Cristinia sonorae TaxID=1940300 RepID=A0A8K0UK14_9AGAR|nr:hypothetical protein BXZ70DRAFT_455082 [Cristinia sonorae]
MPGPMIYVAVAIGTVAAVVAFKEFVYDPHIAPKVEAWQETRRRERRRSGPVAVPAQQQNENEGRRLANSAKTKKKGSVPTQGDDNMSVEMEHMGNVKRSSGPSSIRQRKARSAIEEPNTSIPFSPMAPSQVLFDSSDTESTRSFKSARSPSLTTRSVKSPTPSRSAIASPSPRQATLKRSETPSVPPAHPTPPLSPRLPTPVSNRSVASSRATSPTNSQMYHSASSASSFTPVAIGPLNEDRVYTARSRTASSIDAMSDAGRSVPSAPGSRVTSPFSDYHAVQPSQYQPMQSPNMRSVSSASATVHSNTSSPLILSPNIGSDFSLPSDTDEGLEHMMLSPSLRSGMFSPSVDLARDIHDDPFEVGSETESWDSFGRRTPEL